MALVLYCLFGFLNQLPRLSSIQDYSAYSHVVAFHSAIFDSANSTQKRERSDEWWSVSLQPHPRGHHWSSLASVWASLAVEQYPPGTSHFPRPSLDLSVKLHTGLLLLSKAWLTHCKCFISAECLSCLSIFCCVLFSYKKWNVLHDLNAGSFRCTKSGAFYAP